MSDRGIMKWNAYKSLTEQSSTMDKMRYEMGKEEKPTISNEKCEKINNILVAYHNQEVTIKYFYDGYQYEISGVIEKIEPSFKRLTIEGKAIPFNSIIDIEDPSFSEFDI